jgi:hemolysin activation/secretion protein
VPYGRHTFSLGVSDSRYESTLHTASGLSLQSAGNSHYRFLRDDYVAWRNQVSRLTLSATLTSKQSNNFLAGQFLGVSSRKLAVLDVGGNLSTGLGGGVAGVDLGYSRGLHALGAMLDDKDLPHDAPHAQFEKITYGVSYSHPFELSGFNGSISSRLSGQRAINTLYGSEQISIGGLYSVRGFYENSLAGDHGYFLRNDVSIGKAVGSILGRPLTMTLYWGVDAGKVTSIASGVPSGSLVGTAVGLAVASGPFFLDVSVGRPLRQPDSFPTKEGTNGFFRFSYSF